jgi:hypothetical protein
MSDYVRESVHPELVVVRYSSVAQEIARKIHFRSLENAVALDHQRLNFLTIVFTRPFGTRGIKFVCIKGRTAHHDSKKKMSPGYIKCRRYKLIWSHRHVHQNTQES